MAVDTMTCVFFTNGRIEENVAACQVTLRHRKRRQERAGALGGQDRNCRDLPTQRGPEVPDTASGCRAFEANVSVDRVRLPRLLVQD